ncbi:hypothetical protein ACFLRA_02475 [Bdellovibrionota bacterium]
MENLLLNNQIVLLSNGDPKNPDLNPVSVMNANILGGKINIRTALGRGWKHNLKLNGGSQKIQTSLQKIFSDQVSLTLEETFDFNPGDDDPSNILMGTIRIWW